MTTKTDNRSLSMKLQLRRRVLEEAKFDSLQVLDLCAGEGHIWRALLEEFRVTSYVPVDKHPRMAGTVRGNLTGRFLDAFNLECFNVVDIDTYGEAWEPWRNIFERIAQRTVIFLTHGAPNIAMSIGFFARGILGIPPEWNLPKEKKLQLFAAQYILAQPSRTSRISKAYRITLPNVSYYGTIAEPRKLSVPAEMEK
jgi:hypothetical protein